MLQGNHSHWRWILVTLTYDLFMGGCSQPLCVHMLFRKCFNLENLESILTDVTNTITTNILLRGLVFFYRHINIVDSLHSQDAVGKPHLLGITLCLVVLWSVITLTTIISCMTVAILRVEVAHMELHLHH